MYYEVWKRDGKGEILSAEFLCMSDAVSWAEDLERRGWSGVSVYEIQR